MLDDRQLLHDYAVNGSETAFASLVDRHLNLVFATALRRIGDAQSAQDVAQLVFTDLARKARSLPANVILAGWLHRAATFAATDILRSARRRTKREQDAVAMNVSAANPAPEWEQLRPLIDSGLERLDHADRDALLLRFFEQRSLKDVGASIGLSEDASRKRIERALESLRRWLGRRGITTTANALSTTLTACCAQTAPPGLVTQLAPLCLAAGAKTGAGTFVGNLIHILLMSKAKMAVVAAVLVAATVSPLVISRYASRNSAPPPPAPQLQIGRSVPKEAWRNAGTASPLASLETLLWSMTQAKGNLYAQLTERPTDIAKLASDAMTNLAAENAKKVERIQNITILSVNPRPDSQIEVQFMIGDIDAKKVPEMLVFKHWDWGWGSVGGAAPAGGIFF
jgi:RNA polymerase sigma factor (sigma-70 family)